MSETAGNVDVVTENKSEQVHITEPAVPASADTAESLGVDQASFDKYYKNGDFDWASYGKEQAFKASQRPAQEPTAEPEAPQGAEDAVEAAGLNWEDLGAKVANEGDISEADYQALADIGIPEQVVQDYINAVRDNAQSVIDSVIDQFGGQEQFDEVYTALYTNATLDQRNKLDELLRDPDTREAGVMQAYRLAGMQPPTQQQAPQAPAPAPSRGNAAPAAVSSQGFNSFEEQVQAQRDPRYRTDPTYRQEVMQKIANSTWQHNPRTAGAGL